MKTVVRLTSNRLPEVARRIPQACNRVVAETLSLIEGEIKVGMAEPKSGHVYGNHQASAPGESPAIDTGALVNSIQQTPVTNGSGQVYTNMEYAEVLEYGGADMEARPFMTPAAEAARPEFLRKMGDLESML